MGILYLVSTPIGNLKDITLRAIEVLSQVDVIACEDTRKTSLLLKRLRKTETKDTSEVAKQRLRLLRGGGKQLISYYEESEQRRIPQIIKILKEGQDVALVSSAGTPTISDPGFKLVRECIAQGIKIESIPGPSAILTALITSGFPTDKFLFLGFLPKKPGKRKNLLSQLTVILSSITVTVVAFESPHRLLKTLNDAKEVFGEIEIVICRELTKVHEEIRREKISQAIRHFEKTKPRGEFTLVFNASSI